MQIIGTKQSVCIRKEFRVHQHGRRFVVLGHQYGRRDVMWKHSIVVCVLLKILMLQCSACSNSSRLLYCLALGWDAYQEFYLCLRRSRPHLCPCLTKRIIIQNPNHKMVCLILLLFCFFFFQSIASNKFITKVITGRGGYFPYIPLNEIQTMFSQLARRSARILPADLCTDHAHYVKNIDQRSSEETKTWRSKAGVFLTILFW